MKICNQAILLAMVALGLGACSDENPWIGNAGEGGISLKLSASADVQDAIPVLRSGADALEAPATSDFAISITNMATEEVQKWNTLADFQAQNSFRTGSYTLAAYYGSIDDEGFDKPYYYGDTEVTVLEGREAEATVVAQLANSMVSIDYTDAFKNYFKAYKVTVHSEGHSYIDFESNETRPAFLAPGDVAITVDVTNPSGKSATLQPASFAALARHHYHVTFDVATGQTGDAQLQIVFDDSVEQEDVYIDLTDELFSSPAPKVSPSGFEDGDMIEALSGHAVENQLKYDVIARGGISSAILTISGEGFTPAFGNEIDLVKATATQQQQLADLGIKALGFFKNPDEMAQLDVTDLPAHLPSGKFTVTLMVKDPFTRVSDPVALNISTVPITLNSEAGSAIFNSGQATINVDYNGLMPEENISFTAMSRAGVYKPCDIISVTESTRTRSFEVKSYIFTISLPDTDRESIPVKVFFKNEEKNQLTVPVVIPEYTLEVDAFATYAKMKVSANSADLAAVVNCLKVFNGSSLVNESSVSRNNETGMITVSGLTPSTSYNFAHSLTASKASDATALSFTTEATADVPNGDFSQTQQTINQELQLGGPYLCGAFTYTNWSKAIVSEATGWASVNAKTFYTGSSAINSWFTVVSTYEDNGAMTMRSVSYDHAGTVPSRTGQFLSSTHYCTNVPSSIASKAAGELFLGTYSFDGSEHRTDGITFGSRPTSMSFDYKYQPTGNDKGYALIQLIGEDGTVISSASLQLEAAASMTTKTIALGAYTFGKKATSIQVLFKSSEGDFSTTMANANADNWSGVLPVTPYKHWISDNQYKTFASGSVLTIDNVKLNY